VFACLSEEQVENGVLLVFHSLLGLLDKHVLFVCI
jgi:hypothetical protein